MKLKRLPEDFQVEEVSAVPLGKGPFAVYRLTKRSLGTPEAIEAVLRKWKRPRADIGYGGLKDKHAVTSQLVTLRHGPRHHLKQTNFDLQYLGQAARPFRPQDISANRFRIVLRDLLPEDGGRRWQAAEAVGRDGVPNYFDDQRFGSVGQSGEFIARPWCAGDYERALWLALADPNVHDRPEEREEKRLLREQWGHWKACKDALSRSHRRSIVTYLVDHPSDFRRALALLRVDLRSLYLAAFQSFLWNRILAALLRAECQPEQLCSIRLAGGDVPCYRWLEEAQRDRWQTMTLPLPSARLHLDEGPVKTLYDRELKELGLELRELRVKYPRDTFFSKGQRPVLIVPARFRAEPEDDELHPGRQKLIVSFDLPRGAYATMIVKRLITPGC
jgi:tRNA pseudouridine13 synthase